MAESLWKRFAGLPVEVESYALDRLEQPVTRGFTRVTTLVRLQGGGEEGLGEDVSWFAEMHDREQAAGPILPLQGSWTLESFSRLLEIPEPHRRWAYESAALDLALRQAGTTLAEAVGREPQPVAFVVSPGLGDPPTAADGGSPSPGETTKATGSGSRPTASARVVTSWRSARSSAALS